MPFLLCICLAPVAPCILQLLLLAAVPLCLLQQLLLLAAVDS
jgi:hypothetical protein